MAESELKASKRLQQVIGLLGSLHDEIQALEAENKFLRERLVSLEGRDPGHLATPLEIEGSGKPKSMTQRLQAVYQVTWSVTIQ